VCFQKISIPIPWKVIGHFEEGREEGGGRGSNEKPFMREVLIFSGTTQIAA